MVSVGCLGLQLKKNLRAEGLVYISHYDHDLLRTSVEAAIVVDRNY